MQKNFEGKAEQKEKADAKTMAEINRYTQKDLQSDEVFVFSVLLCDNEIDRDFERFSVKCLKALAPLFVGKTAIKNHSMHAEDQSARTFKTEVVTDESRRNALGEPYTYLKAYCYMPRLAKNAELIAEIEAGIKKEVSVGCAVQSRICSICGRDSRKEPCTHKSGRHYGDKLCYFTLEEPSDAYEWSFVAVPAQKNAGIVKAFSAQKMLKQAMASARADGVFLSRDEASALQKALQSLELQAKDGAAYKQALQEEFFKESAKAFPQFSGALRESMAQNLSTAELKEACAALRAGRKTAAEIRPQLAGLYNANTPEKNEQFKL